MRKTQKTTKIVMRKIKKRHREVPSSYIVLIKDGKVLLQKRFNTGYMDKKYSLPAGHVEKGETFAQCVIREAKEEIGVELKQENIKVAHLMHRFSGLEWGDYGYRVDVFFTSKKWVNTPAIKEFDKHNNLSWFGINNLPKNMVPEVRQALKCIDKGIFYSELGWE